MTMASFTAFLTTFSILIGCVACQDATVRFTVREERPNNTLVGSVAVESLLFVNISNEQFQQFTFQILELNMNMFYIGNTGLLWTKQIIDREELFDCIETCDIEFNVVVYPSDSSMVPLFIRTIVSIDDYNDNKPEFAETMKVVDVSEATAVGEPIIRDSAVDGDRDPRHGVQTYILLPETDKFEIQIEGEDELEFVIVLKQKLDREEASLYKLVVIAEDGGSSVKNTGTLLLDINVTDDNDNFPVFNKKTYNATIPENISLNTTVVQFEASDIDEGDNAKISYIFSNRVPDRVINHFKLNSTSGELTVSGMIDYDEDRDRSFVFQVLAVDHGSPAKSTAVDVIIDIQDVNDNSPTITITEPPGGTVLMEHSDIGSFVAHMEVKDKDSGNNGEVTCNILDPFFALEEFDIVNNYRIVLNGKLDHDTKPEHNVTIICQDKGDLPRQSTAFLVVRVSDRNDNPPVFTQEKYSAFITENNQKGISVLTVSASDNDSGENGKVRYSLQAEASKLFTIDSITGIISTNASIDREIHGAEIIFRVLAADNGDPPEVSTGTVVIKVNDLNDNAPIFKSDPFKLHVSENQVNNTLVGNISVHDPDNGLNGTFYLRFPTDPDVLKYFKFSENGIVTTIQPLDRELHPIHNFYVHAIDYGGRTSSALIIVTVHDENDNKPQIMYPSSQDNLKLVPFTTKSGSSVLQVDAFDYDDSENAELYFYIETSKSNASSIFTIDLHTGIIYINKTLHDIDIDNVYYLSIQVMDGGTPRLQATTSLYIKIVAGETALGQTETATADTNLIIIVVVVVSVTLVLSLIMITVMVRMCIGGRRSGSSTASSQIIMESKEVDPRLLDSSSSSTSSKDSNGNEKLKVDFPDTFVNKGESGSVLSTKLSSIDKHLEEQMYIDKVKQFEYELHKKIDETNSDNSGEMCTRDSGQGGSDMDMNSVSELPVLDIPDSPTGSKVPSDTSFPSPRDEYNSYYGNRREFPKYGNHDNRQSISEHPGENIQMCNYSRNPSKTAERKELSKLRRNPKKVMFSDDLEISSTISNTLSSVSHSDTESSTPSSRPLTFNRMHSYDNSGFSSNRNSFEPRGPLRRSVDQLIWNRNNSRLTRDSSRDDNHLPPLMEKPAVPRKSWLDNSVESDSQVFSFSQNVPDIANSLTNRASYPNNYSVQLTKPSDICV